MARTLRADNTELYRVKVTTRATKYDYETRTYVPRLDDEGREILSTTYYGPYDSKATAGSASRMASGWRGIVERRRQKLTPVALHTTVVDEFGSSETKISAELRWMDA